jgi:hypothetical protein
MVGYKSIEANLEKGFPDSRRTGYYLRSIHYHLRPIPAPESGHLSRSKALELRKLAREKGRRSDGATGLHTGANSRIESRVDVCARSAPAVCPQP